MTAARDVRAALEDPLVGQRLERYDILHRLAQGGMGAVYIGRVAGVAGFERLVAVKVLHPHLAHEEEFVTMFLDEARLAARIRHPNVVATLDVCQMSQGYFLVMEYIEGDHLGSLLQRADLTGKRIPSRVVLRIVLDALGGLSEAHHLTDRKGAALNLVHRDVSPHNILVGVDGISRLTDFGIAKAEVRLSSTRDGQFKGKLSYTAPEQASHAQAEQRSDLFSMGIVLWEALTGSRLFRADTNAATLQKILIEPIPLPSTRDPALAPVDGLLAKALARPMEERFQTAQEMIDAIEAIAPKIGGIAPAREVTALMQLIAGEKLTREAAAIQSAIDRAGGSVRPPPPPAMAPAQPRNDPEAETISQRGVTPSHGLLRSVESPVTGQLHAVAEPERPRGRVALWVAAAVIVVIGLGIGGWWLTSREPPGAGAGARTGSERTERARDEILEGRSTPGVPRGSADEPVVEPVVEPGVPPGPQVTPEPPAPQELETPTGPTKRRPTKRRPRGEGEVLDNPYRQQ